MPGPTKKPTEVLALHDSDTVRKRKKHEAIPADGEPQMPDDLPSSRARRHWKRLVEDLRFMGLLAACDADALERFVRMTHEWHIAMKDVEENGSTLKRANGVAYTNPSVNTVSKLAALLLRLEQELGITPTSRVRIAAAAINAAKPAADSAEEFVSERPRRTA